MESMITPVRRNKGLGDPQKEYTIDMEAGNMMIKYSLDFDAKKYMDLSSQSGT